MNINLHPWRKFSYYMALGSLVFRKSVNTYFWLKHSHNYLKADEFYLLMDSLLLNYYQKKSINRTNFVVCFDQMLKKKVNPKALKKKNYFYSILSIIVRNGDYENLNKFLKTHPCRKFISSKTANQLFLVSERTKDNLITKKIKLTLLEYLNVDPTMPLNEIISGRLKLDNQLDALKTNLWEHSLFNEDGDILFLLLKKIKKINYPLSAQECDKLLFRESITKKEEKKDNLTPEFIYELNKLVPLIDILCFSYTKTPPFIPKVNMVCKTEKEKKDLMLTYIPNLFQLLKEGQNVEKAKRSKQKITKAIIENADSKTYKSTTKKIPKNYNKKKF